MSAAEPQATGQTRHEPLTATERGGPFVPQPGVIVQGNVRWAAGAGTHKPAYNYEGVRPQVRVAQHERAQPLGKGEDGGDKRVCVMGEEGPAPAEGEGAEAAGADE